MSTADVGVVQLSADESRSSGDSRPYIRLVGAVLLQALQDMGIGRGKNGEPSAETRSAERWFMSESTRPWSFLWCCDILDLRPSGIRSELYTRGLYAELRKRVESQRATRRRQMSARSQDGG